MGPSELLAAGVDIHLVASLGITHLHQPHIGQRLGPLVVHLDSHHVVLAVADGESLGEVVRRIEVAQHESRATALDHARQEFHRQAYVSLPALRLEVEHLADDVENVLAALLRRNILLNLVREEYHANLIVVLNGAESQRGSNLRHHVLLHLHLRAKLQRTRHVDQQHHRQLALLLKDLHVGTMKPCRHVPVNVTHVIPKLILSHLAESHSPTLEGRMVLSGEDV